MARVTPLDATQNDYEPIVRPIITPTTSVIGQGAVSMELVGDFNMDNDPLYPTEAQKSLQQAYRFVATPALGWNYDHMHIKMVIWDGEKYKTFEIDYSDSNIWSSHWYDYTYVPEGQYYWRKEDFNEWTTDDRFFLTTNGGWFFYDPWETIRGKAFRTISFEVTGVFTTTNPSGLIYSPTRNGKLIHNSNGKLLYYP